MKITKELIKLELKDDGKILVSAIELHNFLEIKTRYDKWFLRLVKKYDFVENEDYIVVGQKRPSNEIKGFTEYTEHFVTIDVAKEIAMVTNNDNGRKARKYFIEAEKELRKIKEENKQELPLKEKLLLDIINSNDDVSRAIAINNYQTQYVKPLEYDNKKKQELIDGISGSVQGKTQRRLINDIIRRKGIDKIKERWNLLYEFYEQNKGINLSLQVENYNQRQTKKKDYVNKIQYIENVINDMNGLYLMAVKLFESDYKEQLKEKIELM